MAEDSRIDRAEEDIRWLRQRQDNADTKLERIREDLRRDLRDTEARLEKRITESHDAVVSEIGKVQEHLSEQDDLIREQFQRDDDLIASRIDWPSWRNVAITVATSVVGYLILRFGFGIHLHL